MAIGFLSLGVAVCCGIVYLIGRNSQEDKVCSSVDYTEVYRKLAINEL